MAAPKLAMERGWSPRSDTIKTAIHDHGNLMGEIQFAAMRGDTELVNQLVQLAHDLVKRALLGDKKC